MEGGPPPGNQEGAWRGPTLGRARGPPGCPVGPLAPPPLPLYFPPLSKPLDKTPLSPEPLSVLPPPPCQDRGCLEKLLWHPAGRRHPLRETIHSHGRLPDVP